MARGEIKIPMAVDTSGIAKEIDNGLVEPLEDAEDALKALTKVDAGRDLERDLEKASKATEELEDELDDARKGLKELGYASKKVDDDTKAGFGKASENVEEFKNEAAQNFSEVTSSFDGSMESILDLAQGTLGGLASGISGPLGIALGLAAAGIGLVVNGLIEGEEKAEELREQARQFAIEAVNAGQSSEAWLTGAQQIVDRIQELEQLKSTDARWFWQDDPTQLEEWQDALDKSGRSAGELESILASSDSTMRDYRDAVQDNRDALMDEAEALAATTALADEAGMAKIDALEEQIAAQDDILKYLDQEIGVREEAAASAERQKDAGVDAAITRAEAEEEAAQRIETAEQQVQDSVTTAYDSMRDAATAYATTEDGALDIGRWLEYTQEHAAAVATYQSNLQSMKLSPDQWSNLMEMPEDARMQWVAQFVALPEEARAPYAAALNDLGSSGGSSAAVSFDESFNPDADVEITAETGKAEADLKEVSRDRTTDIKVNVTGESKAKKNLDALAKKRHATIEVRANTSPATNSVNSWRRNQENRPLYITVKTRGGGSQLV